MNPIALIWLQFVLCAGLIGFAGVRLSRYGDAIAGTPACRATGSA